MILDIKRLPEIVIGHETDNLTNSIEIDVRPWLRNSPGLDSWNIVVHSPNGETYLASDVVERDGILSWLITDGDTAYPGKGTYEVVAKGANGESISSGPVNMRVADRTKGTVSETPPEAAQGWVDKVLDAAQRADEAAERAENADVGVISAEVENTEDGVRISITDKRGTTTAEVKNGVDGAQGPAGPQGEPGKDGEGAVIDATLTQPGQAADAAATGEAIEGAKEVFIIRVEGLDGEEKADKTIDEIVAAYQKGMALFALFRGRTYNLALVALYDNDKRFEFEADNGTEHHELWFSNGRVTSRKEVRNYSRLPNPEPLIVLRKSDGEQIAEYYGSVRERIELPDDAHIASVARPLVTWADLPDKPFGGSARTLIFPSTVLTLGDGMGIAPITATLNLEAGESYVVTWNGMEYVCEAVEKEVEGIQGTWLGNLPAVTGEGEPTDEPFLIAALPAGNDLGVGGIVGPADGSEMFVLKIEDADGTIKTLDPKYLPMGVDEMLLDKETAIKNAGKLLCIDEDGEISVSGASASTTVDSHYTPQKYGAVADGVTDDTAAIQQALANHRVVHIPGGTYKISGPLLIRSNCGLVLAQDTVLNFTQTSGNCISMMMSASIKGNHATVRVPYAFNGNVIYVHSLLNDDVLAVEPFTKWDPSWKAGRYLTDLNIVKPDSRGFHYSLDGTCTGVAVYICADDNASSDTDSSFIWGLNFSGLRIAGAFVHGILAENLNEAWNHEMRVEAFIDACETGVELRDCNNAYISATIQPRQAYSLSNVYKAYAKNGIVLKRSRNTDLSGSRVWDWNSTYTLWQTNVQNEHIAMYGNCSGTILNDFLYYEMPSYDIRSLIYTDTASNLEKINILQEPFTRWFKPKEREPYFFDGDVDKRLALKGELDELVSVNKTLAFTDVLSKAKNKDGTIYNGVGYKAGGAWAIDGESPLDEPSMPTFYTGTGYIPVATGQRLYCEGMSFENGDDNCRVILFDSSFNKIAHINRGNLITNGSYYFINQFEGTSNSFAFSIVRAEVAYVKINVRTQTVSKSPLMAVDQEIKYTLDGYIADGIKIKASAVEGLEELIRSIIG